MAPCGELRVSSLLVYQWAHHRAVSHAVDASAPQHKPPFFVEERLSRVAKFAKSPKRKLLVSLLAKLRA